MIDKISACNICNDIYEEFVIDNNIKKNTILRHLNEKYKINIDEYISNDVIIDKVNRIPCGYCYLLIKSLCYNYYNNIEKLFMEIADKNNIDYIYIYNLFYGYDV
jgi:hypothetical protein